MLQRSSEARSLGETRPGSQRGCGARAGPLCAVFLATFGLQLAVAWSRAPNPLWVDYHEYRVLAHRLLDQGRYGFAPDWHRDPVLRDSAWWYLYDEHGGLRAPGYPVVLALLDRAFRPEAHAARPPPGREPTLRDPGLRRQQLLFAGLNGLVAVLVAVMARSIFDARVAWWAAGLCLLNPGMIDSLTKLGREPILLLLVSGGLLLVLRTARRGSLPAAVGAGLCFGLGAYVKETVTWAGLFAGLWLLLMARRHRGRGLLRAASALALVTALLVVPWPLRNTLRYGQPVGFTTAFGWAFWKGTTPTRWLERQPPALRERLDPGTAAHGAEAEARLRRAALLHAREDPVAFARALVRNAALYWSPLPRRFWFEGRLGALELAACAYYALLFPAAAWGLWRQRRRPEAALVGLVLVGLTALHALTISYPRYRFPAEPLLAIFAGWSLARLGPRALPGRRESASAEPVAD